MEPREFDPLEFSRLADRLVTDGVDEATLRTAIGRVYYAVFLIARAKTGIVGQRFAHERVRTAISPHQPRLASLIGTLGHYRLVADYEITPVASQDRNWRRNWEIVRENAAEVLQILESLPTLTPSNPEDQSRDRQ